MGTLHYNVVILCCSNVAGTSFSQRCENNLLTTLYNVVFTLCVCWAVPCVKLIKDDDIPCVKLIKDDDIPCVKVIKDDDNPCVNLIKDDGNP